MAGKYEIHFTDDKGVRILLLDDALWFVATRHSGRIGALSLGLPATFDTSLISEDTMIQIWRAPTGGRLSLWRAFFVRKWRYATAGAIQQIVVGGPDENDMLRRRIVAHYAGEAESAITNEADDMMKTVVRDAFLDGANPAPAAGTRVVTGMNVAADITLGPVLTKQFAWQRLLMRSGGGLLPAIQAASKEAGTEVFYDVVTSDVNSSSITLEFRTYTGQPGADLTSSVIFDQQRGNLDRPFIEFDYLDEINYVYAGGQGEEDDRNVQQVSDDTRYNASKWNRCEGFANAANQKTNNGVRESGRNLLDKGRPRRRFGAMALDTEGTRFGRDWNYGDRVTARYRGFEFAAIIKSVTISVNSDGDETVQARLDWED